MKIVNQKVQQRIKSAMRCEFPGCNRRPTDPCHISARGTSSHKQIDVPCNLLAGCRFCHDRQHQQFKPSRKEMQEIAAKREGMTQEQVEETIWKLQQRQRNHSCECPQDLAIQVGRDAFVCLGCGKEK